MLKNKCLPLLQYNEIEKQQVLNDCELKESVMEEDVDAILNWFNKQPHLVDAGIEKEVIESLLIISKGSREKTKRKIDKFYTLKALTPEFFQDRDEFLSSNKELFSWFRHIILPKLYDGQRISLFHFVDEDPGKFSYDNIMKMSFILSDIRLKNDYMKSDIWIMDLKLMSIGHVVRLNPLKVKKCLQLFQEGIGTRIGGIHILNSPELCHKVMVMLKQYTQPKIMDRIFIHESLEDLHKYVPQKCLPKDYGGDEATTTELAELWRSYICSPETKNYLVQCSKRMSDESKRPNFQMKPNPFEGSFKVLNID